MRTATACITALLVVGVVKGAWSATPVNLTLYGEALCPDTQRFVLRSLSVAMKEVEDLFTLTYIPWGNAEVLPDGKFECQHGEMECVMNTVHACVLFYYPKRTEFWPFLHCAFTHGEKQDPVVAQKCAGLASMDWDKIDSCYKGSQGHNLELMYSKETDSLDPPHTYVPWVTLNGEHDVEAEGPKLTKEICDAYTGTDKPPACHTAYWLR